MTKKWGYFNHYWNLGHSTQNWGHLNNRQFCRICVLICKTCHVLRKFTSTSIWCIICNLIWTNYWRKKPTYVAPLKRRAMRSYCFKLLNITISFTFTCCYRLCTVHKLKQYIELKSVHTETKMKSAISCISIVFKTIFTNHRIWRYAFVNITYLFYIM